MQNFLKMLLTFISFADIINITVADITADVITTTDITARDRKESALMKCPVCGKEMEKGETFHLMRGNWGEKLFWAPDEFFEKTHIATKRTVEKAGGKAFSIGRSIFDNEPRYSWYCRDCEMVLIETKNKR